jgi:hypothetical membrane protein
MIRRILLLAFCFAVYQVSFSQKSLPVLRSDSSTINIRIDGDVVGWWYVEPDTKAGATPEVFLIDRSFHEKKVSYISNRDSIGFMIKPGDKADFIISLNGRNFPTEITMADEPVFLHGSDLIVIISILVLISLITYSKRDLLRIKPLLYLGIAAPLLFWTVTIIGGFIHGNYNHLHNVVSELGAIGTRSETFMSITEMLVGVLSIFSVIGFYKACKQQRISSIPVLTILSLSLSMFWASTFPMHHELHGAIGPLPLVLMAGVLLAIFLWRGKQFFSFRLISAISFILMMLILLRTLPNLRSNYEGLIQRLFYLGWTTWSVSLSLFFLQRIEIKSHR